MSMRPLDFVSKFADANHNTPAGDIVDALSRRLVIRSATMEWTVLSYYYDTVDKRMVIDIEIKD